MASWIAAQIADPLERIDTPALILDLDAFERNLARMDEALRASRVRLRPHAKSHKCVEIARRQIERGAVGICCQKVSEAAVFVHAGIADVLVTNEVVGAPKLRALMEIAHAARIGVLADDASQVTALSAAAHAQRARPDIYVEIDVGSKRCGVAPGQAAALAAMIHADPNLRFGGLHCYHGAAQHLRTPEERAAAIGAASRAAREARRQIEALGIEVPIVTGGGTGSFVHERDSGAFEEVQPGSYIFMDRDYAANRPGSRDVAFEHSLFVLASVMSRPTPERAVLDAGLKASSVDSGMPSVWQRTGLRYVKASDEHGVVETDRGVRIELGDKLLLVPGHCDPTVNLYDRLVCVRNDIVEAIWPIDARGALL